MGSELAAYITDIVPWYLRAIEQLSTKANFLNDLNIEWARLGMRERIRAKYVYALRDDFISEKLINQIWGSYEVVDEDHFGIVKPTRYLDESFVILKEFFHQNKIEYKEIMSIKGSILTKIINLIYFVDYATIYKAIIDEIDPSPVKSIDFVKSKLK